MTSGELSYGRQEKDFWNPGPCLIGILPQSPQNTYLGLSPVSDGSHCVHPSRLWGRREPQVAQHLCISPVHEILLLYFFSPSASVSNRKSVIFETKTGRLSAIYFTHSGQCNVIFRLTNQPASYLFGLFKLLANADAQPSPPVAPFTPEVLTIPWENQP